MRVDLHIHTTASDGRWAPEQLVEQVRRAGIGLFAVADHDTVAHVTLVQDAVRGSGMAFLRAVEISSTLKGRHAHILGYGIDPEHPRLLDLLSQNRAMMEGVDQQSVQLLIDAGYDISHAEYEAYVDDPARGGWKALNLFIDRGFCRDVNGFFRELFVGDLALSMPAFADPRDATVTIREAGGVPICAHPGHSTRSNAEMLDQLVALGLEGLECFSPYHDDRTTHAMLAYCRQHDLLITAGSDCHGGFVGRALGEPETYLEDLTLGPLLDLVVR